MRLLTTVSGLRSSLEARTAEQTLGLVPTMGALHPGHLSLIKRAVSENDLVVVSIFVNPLQFGPQEDCARYPSSLEADLQLCEQEGVDFVFAPNSLEMGITAVGEVNNHTVVVPPQEMTAVLCGPFRPVHFTGVATIVTKLLTIVAPDLAYFGEKDAQQLAIVKRLVQDLKLKTEISSVPTVREKSGLAYSSRNQYLSVTEKAEAAKIYQGLIKAHDAFKQGIFTKAQLTAIVRAELNSISNLKIEYIDLVHPDSLIPLNQVEDKGLLAIALWLGSTRLIDNIMLRLRQPIIAIDGPAGAGKSTVTRYLAKTLGLMYLDTGAMYRALTWLFMHYDIDLEDTEAIALSLADLRLELIPSNDPLQATGVIINDHDVSQVIRSPEVSKYVSKVSAIPAVRRRLVQLQQELGVKGGLVAEGRDIGTKVFPDAELKIFLTASVKERSLRRLREYQQQGINNISLEELAQGIEARDKLDTERKVSPLQQAPDAIVISTDGLTIEEVINKIVNLYETRVQSPSKVLGGTVLGVR
ncbi:MAG: bifunctional pantoate--beta-alanine ligase/(d)CMP kinase [Gloeocapsa sp. DLM2.Bin57]|nr:MAG: bifunctional pantoate--beta-alanine ligase/(d)CMP kinase [Gloeocapsa sp. DLM2.Bin57]